MGGMRNYLYLDGQRFGRLTVVAQTDERYHGSIVHKCQCDCGVMKLVASRHLLNGQVQSCGCLRRENAKHLPRLEKQTPWVGHPLYRVWAGMVRRCELPTERSYKWYGAKGIRVCEAWRRHPAAFVEWATMGGWTYDNRWTVDRIDSQGPYSPWNCQMIPKSANSRRACEAAALARRLGLKGKRALRREQLALGLSAGEGDSDRADAEIPSSRGRGLD